MCGIAGCATPGGTASAEELRDLADSMAATLRHRGPDGDGTWVDPGSQVALGHTRLAVIDLSDEGHQPMVSADERWVLVYNGEVYNHRSLRRQEEAYGYPFRGHSDTEVLLAAIARLGVARALARVHGMFALAAYDRDRRVLWLGRDRLGEKPLFYGRSRGVFLFASELTALREHPAFDATVDRDALAAYLRFKYVPAPRSIFRRFRKLPPGTLLEVDARDVTDLPEPSTYWSAWDVAAAGRRDPFTGSFEDAVDALERRLGDAVDRMTRADVPVGALLSGGVDSSTVVALMQARSDRPVRTFTVGYEDARWDEAASAAKVASHLGTDHTELRVTGREALDVVPRLATIYDEPFGDSSQVPTHLIAALARHDVTVALTGDGGDELFGGYNRHVWAPRVWRRISRLPPAVRRAVAAPLLAVPQDTWDRVVRYLGGVLPPARHRLAGQKVHKLAAALGAATPLRFYRTLLTHWDEPDATVTAGREPAVPDAWPPLPTFAESVMYLDLVGYLPDDILTKVDRATMAVALEARLPFLAPEVVEFAWRLPLEHRIVDGTGKRVVRALLDRHVPGELTGRPKMGFGVPVGDWLRSDLRGWAEGLLAADRLEDEGFFEPAVVRRVWRDHLSGRNHQYELWTILMFQAWLSRG